MRRKIKRRLSGIQSQRRRYFNNRGSKAKNKKQGNHHINHMKDLQFKGQLTAKRWKNGKAYFGNTGKSLKRKRYYLNRQ